MKRERTTDCSVSKTEYLSFMTRTSCRDSIHRSIHAKLWLRTHTLHGTIKGMDPLTWRERRNIRTICRKQERLRRERVEKWNEINLPTRSRLNWHREGERESETESEQTSCPTRMIRFWLIRQVHLYPQSRHFWPRTVWPRDFSWRKYTRCDRFDWRFPASIE